MVSLFLGEAVTEGLVLAQAEGRSKLRGLGGRGKQSLINKHLVLRYQRGKNSSANQVIEGHL